MSQLSITISWHIIATPTTNLSANHSVRESLNWWLSTAVTITPALTTKARTCEIRPISQYPIRPPSTIPSALAAMSAPPQNSATPAASRRKARYVISRLEPNCISRAAA
ncbi:hypothetical protein D3C75_1093050 [compost metagenome]